MTKELLRQFVTKEIEEIITLRGNYTAKQVKKKARNLENSLVEKGESQASAFQHVEDALRYLAGFLADSGRHSEAMRVAILLNEFRARYKLRQGRIISFCMRKFHGFFDGYGYRPLRVLRLAIFIWLIFGFLFYEMSKVTNAKWGEPAIVLSDFRHREVAEGQDEVCEQGVGEIQCYHYFYFSGVTLTTLGYGDIRPNTRYWWGVFPSIFAFVEACIGYGLLGCFVVVFLRRSQTHPYTRLVQWHREFENEVLERDKEEGDWPKLYKWDWKRYD